MEKVLKLSNGLTVVYRKNPETPRIALNFFIKSGVIDEKKAGETSLITKLLLQGTNNLSSKELADKIDFYGIDLITDVKQDYLKIKALFLNDDTEVALAILEDMILNSTFENFEKEVNKLKGEIISDLDSAKTKALDNLIKNIYTNHPYGNSYTKVLEDIDAITKEDVKNLYYSKLYAHNCVISIVGDIEEEKIISLLEKHFAQIKSNGEKTDNQKINALTTNKTVTIEKEDVAQAQIFKSWILPGVKDKDLVVFMVLNSILGSCGLSSRLFLELREKRGLAYVVRSSLDVMDLSSTFTLYIASAPKNIKTALDGFKTEVDKLKAELVSEDELQSAKNNIIGKRAFLHETNSQQSHYLGYYELLGLGADFDSEIENKILNVTAEDIKRVANQYLTDNFVISLLAPKEFLN